MTIYNHRQSYTLVHQRQNGFTLIEVLIASSILGVMMLLLFGSLRISSRSWNAGEEQINKASQMTVVQNFFRSYITSALVMEDDVSFGSLESADDYDDIDTQNNPDEYANPVEQDFQEESQNVDDPNNLDLTGSQFVSFQGNDHQLRFISVMPLSAGRGGPQLFTIGLRKNKTLQLVVTVTPFLPLLKDAENSGEEVSILDNIEMFAISYWGRSRFTSEPEWTQEWNERNLPQMVRIEIKLENEHAWPAMIIAPRLAKAEE